MHVPTLSMSNIVSNDNILSPVSDWDHSRFTSPGVDALTSVNFPNFSLPSPPLSISSRMQSPMPTSKMLKSRLSPDGSESDQQLCISTHQVFDVPPVEAPSPAEVEEPSNRSSVPPSTPSSVVPSKRPSTSVQAPVKKARSSGERVTTKDFVPPDVTGLSKREARLVKNRAAAFLSRQRKREEFENMEIRVAELEQENARLHAIANGSREEDHSEDLLSEVEQLRRQLAASKERERELSAELSRKSDTHLQPVKMESYESDIELPSRSGTPQPPNKSGASLGLMVLLCALPTLLSLPTHSALPTTFSLPLSGSASLPPSTSPFDMNSIIPNDLDWAFNSGSSFMDLDLDNEGRISGSSLSTASTASASNFKKLEFVDMDSEALGLNGLDISFDAKASQDGKIRVRIHPPSASSSAATTAASSPAPHSENEDQLMYSGSEVSGPSASSDSTPQSDGSSSSDFDSLGPFLGVGGSDYGYGCLSGMSVDSLDSLSSSSFDFRSSFDEGFGSTPSSGRRRVRIALKSLPGQGSEGGEWEVQVC